MSVYRTIGPLVRLLWLICPFLFPRAKLDEKRKKEEERKAKEEEKKVKEEEKQKEEEDKVMNHVMRKPVFSSPEPKAHR